MRRPSPWPWPRLTYKNLPTAAFTVLVVLLLAWAQALELHFIDVGQGDAVLIRSGSGQNVLYDGGRADDTVLAYLRSVDVETLDLVIASHADADHIGGLAAVVEHYRPRFYLDNGLPHTTQTYARLLGAVAAAGSSYLTPTARRIGMGDISLSVLPPPGDPVLGQNDNSVGLIVEFGEFRAALTGDATGREFDWWWEVAPELLTPVTVYKASHHGSSNGDTTFSLNSFGPEAIVISVGAGNSYGHPTEETSLLYYSAPTQVYRTDLNGSILFKAALDGSFAVEPNRGEANVPAPLPVSHLLAIAPTEEAPDSTRGKAVVIECVLFDPGGRDDGNEVVTLRALTEVDLSGWILEDAANHSFALPSLAIYPGESLQVPNAGRPVWNNDGDTAFLYDPSGTLIDSRTYTGRGSSACW